MNEQIPAGIGELQDLINLKLNNNKLQELTFDVNNLVQLRYLNLSHNQLSQLPAEIKELRKLKCLCLDKNQFTTLSFNLGNLKKLTILGLDNNRLTNVSFNIGKFTPELETLSLSNNQLEEVPAGLERMANLVSLNLNDNKLKVLPDSFRNLFLWEKIHIILSEDNLADDGTPGETLGKNDLLKEFGNHVEIIKKPEELERKSINQA